jgi:hypothetical protein
MTPPEEEKFSLWKDPMVRAASIHLLMGIIALVVGVIPIIILRPRYWIGDFLPIDLMILSLINSFFIVKLYFVMTNVRSDPRLWKIRYQTEKEILGQRLQISNDVIRKRFNRWKNAENRAGIYSIILGLFAILFYLLLVLSAITDEEGYISYTSFYSSLYGLLFIGIWSGCYFWLFIIRRERWCRSLNINKAHVKYLLKYPKEDYYH